MPAVLIYVQHLLGIGHLMRARLIAEALADVGFDVHLVSGGMPDRRAHAARRAHVQLPPIRVSDASFMPLRDADGVPIDDAYRRRRRDLLLAAFEAVGAGRWSSSRRFRSDAGRCASSSCRCWNGSRRRARGRWSSARVRDILQLRQKPEREREMLALGQALVRRGPRARRSAASPASRRRFRSPPSSARRCTTRASSLAPGRGSPPARAGERSEIVVSAGGGAVGIAPAASRAGGAEADVALRPSDRGECWPAPTSADEGCSGCCARPVRARSSSGRASIFRRCCGQAFVSVSQGRLQHGARRRRAAARGRWSFRSPATGRPSSGARAMRLRELGSCGRGRRRPDDVAGGARAGDRRRRNARALGPVGLRLRRRRSHGGDRREFAWQRGRCRRSPTRAEGMRHMEQMSPWRALDAELDPLARRAAGARRSGAATTTRAATRRRSHGCWRSPARRDVPGRARRHSRRARAEPRRRSGASAVVTVVQHGYAHRNHAPPGARNGSWARIGRSRRSSQSSGGARTTRASLRYALRGGAGPAMEPHRSGGRGAASDRGVLRSVDLRAAQRGVPRAGSCAVQYACRSDRVALGIARSSAPTRPSHGWSITCEARREGACRRRRTDRNSDASSRPDRRTPGSFWPSSSRARATAAWCDWLDARAAFAAPSPPPVTSARSA